MFIQISILGKGKITNTVKTTAEYRAPNLISIVLPVSARNRKRSISSEYGIGFNISLSYDNTNFGEDLTFIIYDDSCYSCNSTTSTCTLLVISKVKMNFISWYRWLKENCNDSCFVSLSEFMFKNATDFIASSVVSPSPVRISSTSTQTIVSESDGNLLSTNLSSDLGLPPCLVR